MGSSCDPPDPFTTTDWAQYLAQFLDTLDIERAQVLGLSWGDILVQEFYRLCPDRVLSLILCDTYAGWKGSLPESVCKQRLERCFLESSLPPEEFPSRWVPEFFTEAASRDLKEEISAVVSDFHPLGFRLMAKSLADTGTTDLLPSIGVPTLLLWGNDDRRSPMKSRRSLFAGPLPTGMPTGASLPRQRELSRLSCGLFLLMHSQWFANRCIPPRGGGRCGL